MCYHWSQSNVVGLKGLLGKYHLSKSKVVSLKFHSASYLQRNPVRDKVMDTSPLRK